MTDLAEVVVGMAEVVAVSTGPAVAVSFGPAEVVVAVNWSGWGGGGTAEDVDWAEATDDGWAWVGMGTDLIGNERMLFPRSFCFCGKSSVSGSLGKNMWGVYLACCVPSVPVDLMWCNTVPLQIFLFVQWCQNVSPTQYFKGDGYPSSLITYPCPHLIDLQCCSLQE